MSYFKPFPKINYEFPDDQIRFYKNISIRPAAVEALKNDKNLRTYLVQDGETPETLAYKFYGDESLNWAVMLTNDVMNLYTDWPLNDSNFRAATLDKYRVQADSDGILRTLSDVDAQRFVDFAGSASNNYTSSISIQDSDNSPKIILRPHHFEDADKNVYSKDSSAATRDAYGNAIESVELFPVSIWDYEYNLNEGKRVIHLPSAGTVQKMRNELKVLVNA